MQKIFLESAEIHPNSWKYPQFGRYSTSIWTPICLKGRKFRWISILDFPELNGFLVPNPILKNWKEFLDQLAE